MNGWQVICRQLQHLDVRNVFGIPGTQNAELFSEIAHTNINVITTSSEKSAAFAAIGYAIGTGAPSVLLTIAGPGFCYTAAPLVEAAHDSVPVVNIVIGEAEKPGRKFQLQAIDHEGLASRLAKATRTVKDLKELPKTLEWAWRAASTEEPGPVVVLLDREMLNGEAGTTRPFDLAPVSNQLAEADVLRVAKNIAGKRVLVLAGRGAAAAREELEQLVARYKWAVISTPSGRGILSEHNSSVLNIDGCSPSAINGVIEEFDIVLAIGAKLSHNGSLGFRMRLPKQKLIHVDASSEVLGANYDTCVSLNCDARIFCRSLISKLEEHDDDGTSIDVDVLRARLASSRTSAELEPQFAGEDCGTAENFFSTLRQALPENTIFVLDSGYHQVLARKYLVARFPMQIVFPSDFQSMGFALPAAIGLSLARPDRPVAVIHGDGGFRMCAMDLLTAAAERLSVAVCVIDDGKFGLIRMQQLASGNPESGVDLPRLEYLDLAHACCTLYFDSANGLKQAVQGFLDSDGPALICQSTSDARARKRLQSLAKRKGQLRRILGPRITRWLKKK